MDANATPGLYSNSFNYNLAKGLYTNAHEMSIPAGYTPDAMNVFVNRRKNVQTRYGTQHLLSNKYDIFFHTLNTRLGFPLLITKEGNALNIYYIESAVDANEITTFTQLLPIPNVFNHWSSRLVPDFVTSLEGTTRVYITTGFNHPVVLAFYERQTYIDNTTTVTIAAKEELANISTTQYICRVDGVIQTPTTDFTYNTGTGVLTFAAAKTGVVDLIGVVWSWGAEAMIVLGNQLSQTLSRFNVDDGDLTLPTPTAMLQGIESLPSYKDRLPITLYDDGLAATPYTYNNNPDSEFEFTFSDGIVRSTGNEEIIVPGITHVTFGALNSANDDISQLGYIRNLSLLEFKGEASLATGIQSRYVATFIDNTNVPVNYGATTGDIGSRVRHKDQADIVGNTYATANTDYIQYISFDATPNVGVASNVDVKVVHTDAFWIGSAANKGNSAFTAVSSVNGDWYPFYGLGEHCDTNAGSFPRFCEMHEGRLVLASFPSRPQRVVLSAVYDTASPFEYYNNFQINNSEQLDSDAVIIELNTYEPITAVKSFSSTLFIFTATQVYSVSGGDNGITPVAKYASVVANVGAVNNRCVELVENSVYFLSKQGVYRLYRDINIGGFTVQLVSEAINNLLLSPYNAELAWMSYAQSDTTLYMGVTAGAYHFVDDSLRTYCDTLLVYNVEYGAWSKFTDYTRQWHSNAGTVVELNRPYLITQRGYKQTNPDIVSYPYRYQVDETPVETIVTKNTFNYGVLNDLPFTCVNDYGINDIGVSGDLQIVKVSRTQCYINSNNEATGPFIYPASLDGTLPFVVFADGVITDEWSYDLSEATLTVTAEGTIVQGNTFPCYYMTALLIASSTDGSSFISSYKINEAGYLLLGGEYSTYGNFKLAVKKVDTAITQPSEINYYPQFVGTDYQLDTELFDTPYQYSRGTLKFPFNIGGVVDFYQLVVYGLNSTQWELVAMQIRDRPTNTKRVSRAKG